MNLVSSISRYAGSLVCAVAAVALAQTAGGVETMAVGAEVIGRTPVSLGYNLGHFHEGSNAADWFRYSGVDSARMFIARRDLEVSDDKGPWGDSVTDKESFFARREGLRANAANPGEPLSGEFVDWDAFHAGIAKSNGYPLATLRDAGVEVLANITVGKAPVADDWAGRWELWQHYYAVAHVMSHKYGVRRYSMYNEPNLAGNISEEQWLDLLLVCSDAIQSAIQDVNSRHKLSLKPEIFAPNTAGGASKFDDKSEGEGIWGTTAITNLHRRLDGSTDKNWRNFHVYNYQKYGNRQFDEAGRSGFLTDYRALRKLIDADMRGESQMPISLTEFNVRTAAHYDRSEDSPDNPVEAVSLGATLAGMGSSGMQQMYLFKFGQTDWKSKYGIKKNGTHFVQNSSPYQYGGATRGAEVYRMFAKAARGARPIHRVTASAGASPGLNKGLWNLATQDEAAGMAHLFLSNRDDRTIPIEIDFSALGIPAGNPFFIEEVSATRVGGVVRRGELAAGKTMPLELPAHAVWLVSVPTGVAATSTTEVVADTELGDGAAAKRSGGSAKTLEVHANGTVDGRRVALIRLPVPAADGKELRRVLLEMAVKSTGSGGFAQAHVYGIEDNDWSEEDLNWQKATAFLKSGVPAGNRIANNVVTGHGGAVRMLGQLAADSAEMTGMGIDVTEFARSRSDGMASFLIVQEHRWDVALPSLTKGDTQPAGLGIVSREHGDGHPPRLVGFVSDKHK